MISEWSKIQQACEEEADSAELQAAPEALGHEECPRSTLSGVSHAHTPGGGDTPGGGGGGSSDGLDES